MTQPGLLAALTAGLVSFISPCVLPLLPAYLSLLSGLTVKELSGQQKKAKLFGTSLMFSAGFTLAFTILGIVFAGGMSFVGGGASRLFSEIAGVVVVVLGLNMLFDFIRILGNDARLIQKFAGKGRGQVNAFLMGLAFAAGWSPCIGPILASILLMAARNANVGAAAILLIVYSAGFAIPFTASAIFFEKLSPLLRFLKKHGNSVRVVSGILLIGFGAAMIFGSVSKISAAAAQAGAAILRLTTDAPIVSRIIGAAVWLSLALLPARTVLQMRKSARIHEDANDRRFDNAAWKPDASTKARASYLFAGIFVLLATLELVGAVSLLGMFGGWLTFSGI